MMDARRAALPHPPGSVALLARLRSPDGREVAVATVHVYHDWKRHDLQTLQAASTARALLKMSKNSDCSGGCPVLFCGDFNAQPHSVLYELLCQGKITAKKMTTLRPQHTPQLVRVISTPLSARFMVDVPRFLLDFLIGLVATVRRGPRSVGESGRRGVYAAGERLVQCLPRSGPARAENKLYVILFRVLGLRVLQQWRGKEQPVSHPHLILTQLL